MVDLKRFEVDLEQLRWNHDYREFNFKSTAELPAPEKLEDIVKGQEVAKDQLKSAIRLGQNALLVGPPGCGKSLLARLIAEQYSQEMSAKQNTILQDQLLANNFDDTFEPLALTLPTPMGSELKNDLNQLSNYYMKKAIDKLTPEDEKRVKAQLAETEKEKRWFVENIAELKKDPRSKIPIPDDDSDDESNPDMRSIIENALSSRRRERSVAKKEDLIDKAEFKLQLIDQKIEAYKLQLEQKGPEWIINKYKDHPKVVQYLAKLLTDMKQHPIKKKPEFLEMMMPRSEEEDEKKVEAYKVNLIVNNKDTKGLPVQFIENPTLQNLIGDVQHDPMGLGGHKPHMRAKAGKLPKASGGVVIIDELVTIFKNSVLCDYLLTVLEERKVRIGGGHGLVGGGTSAGIETEPVEADCVIIGCANEDIRAYTTPKMARRFKHKVLFDSNMPNTPENRMAYANFVRYEVENYNADPRNKEKIPHFSPEGVSAIIEEGARFAARFSDVDAAQNLTNILDPIKDIVQKAGLRAIDREKNLVTRAEVEEATAEMREPAKKDQSNYVRRIKDGTIILKVDGSEVGYMNGLVVHKDPFGLEYFGLPARLEVTSSVGNRGLVSITRESKLSGDLFTKSHEVIIGYFKHKYEQDDLKLYEARLDFNQMYNPLDGDSASIATAMDYISCFGNVPLKQNLSVTGSMNQRGDVQAIGGVNEKIEGFYRVCKELGLTGNQGVIVPKSNVHSLMLEKDILQDVNDGKFRIYAVSTLDEAIELMTGLPAGDVHTKAREGMKTYTQNYCNSKNGVTKPQPAAIQAVPAAPEDK